MQSDLGSFLFASQYSNVRQICVQMQRQKTISLKQNMKTHWQNGWHVEHEIDKNHCRNSMAKKKNAESIEISIENG